MAKYALIKFKINNDFYDWEAAFYSSQARARKFGIVEIFHGRESNDSSSCAMLAIIDSADRMDKFLQEASGDIVKSGHILETTEVTFYEN